MADDKQIMIRLALPDDQTPMIQLTRAGLRPWSPGYALIAERDLHCRGVVLLGLAKRRLWKDIPH